MYRVFCRARRRPPCRLLNHVPLHRRTARRPRRGMLAICWIASPCSFPHVGAAWGNSPLARANHPPVRRRWSPKKGRFACFPTSSRSYCARRRIRPGLVAASSSANPPTESEEGDRDDATSTVSTAPTYRFPDFPDPLRITVLMRIKISMVRPNSACAWFIYADS